MSTHLQPGTSSGNLRRGLIMTLTTVTVLATAASFSQVSAINTGRTTIPDNMFNAPAAPTTKLGVYNLTAEPTAPKHFFADGVPGTVQFSTLPSGTEPVTAKTGDTLIYTITLPKGLLPALPADSATPGWETHWAVTATTAGSTTLTRTQTATTAHQSETTPAETVSVPVTGNKDVADRSTVTTTYSHSGYVSEHPTASTTIDAVATTDWGIWGAAATPDDGDKFKPGKAGTLRFSTLDPNDPAARETLTYRTGEVRTYTLELPTGLRYKSADLDEKTGWDTTVTEATRPDGGVTVTITQKATQNFSDTVFRPDTHSIAVQAETGLATNSSYTIKYGAPERHTSTHTEQSGTILALQPIPFGFYSAHGTGSGWGGDAGDVSALVFDTLPSNVGSVEAPLKVGDKLSNRLTFARLLNLDVSDLPAQFSTPHFAGVVQFKAVNNRPVLEIEFTVTQAPENGIYPNETVTVPIRKGPQSIANTPELTVDLPESVASPQPTRVAFPSGIKLDEPIFDLPAVPWSDVNHTPRANWAAFLGPDRVDAPINAPAGYDLDYEVTLPRGSSIAVVVYENSLTKGQWKSEIIQTADTPTSSHFMVKLSSLSEGANLPRGIRVDVSNNGLYGSLEGAQVQITRVDPSGALPVATANGAVHGWSSTTFGAHNVAVADSVTGSPELALNGTAKPELSFDLLGSGVDKETWNMWNPSVSSSPWPMTVRVAIPDLGQAQLNWTGAKSGSQDGWNYSLVKQVQPANGKDGYWEFTFTPLAKGSSIDVQKMHFSSGSAIVLKTFQGPTAGRFEAQPGTTGYLPTLNLNWAVFAGNYVDATNQGGLEDQALVVTLKK